MDPLRCWQQVAHPTAADRAKLGGLAALALLAAVVALLLWRGDQPTPGKRSDFMDCEGAAVCGVLALQSGLGAGVYRGWPPSVHGLWPQVPPYGNSACLAPTRSPSEPAYPAPCFDSLGLQVHEWRKHGVCAGTKDAADFAQQVCDLAALPLRLMRLAGQDFKAQQRALLAAGLHVFQVDGRNFQFLLSACAGCDGVWRLTAPSRFAEQCAGTCGVGTGGGANGVCLPGRHGPPCAADRDCAGAPHCVRCARSGFCTDVPR